jgi:hypothetical protein
MGSAPKSPLLALAALLPSVAASPPTARELAAAGDAAGALARIEAGRAAAPPVSLADLRARVLATDQVLLEYASGEAELLVLLVSQDRCRAVLVPVPADSLAALAGRLRGGIDAGVPDAAAARALHGILVDCIAQDLPPEARLVIAADGPLAGLPFAALHDGRSYLVERHATSRTTSATALAAGHAGRVARRIPPALAAYAGPRPPGEVPADTAVVENVAAAMEDEVRRRVLEDRLPPDVALQRMQMRALREGRPMREWAAAAVWGRMRALRPEPRFPGWLVPVGLLAGLVTVWLALRLTSRPARADETA